MFVKIERFFEEQKYFAKFMKFVCKGIKIGLIIEAESTQNIDHFKRQYK